MPEEAQAGEGGNEGSMIEWRCHNDHLLGFVLSSGRVARLLLVDPHLIDMQPLAIVTGAAEVRCLICGDYRTWHLGDDLRQALKGTVV